MSIFSRILGLGSVVNDAKKTIADGEQILADVTAMENDPNIAAAVAANPDTAAALARVSQEIRSFQEDVSRVKADLHF